MRTLFLRTILALGAAAAGYAVGDWSGSGAPLVPSVTGKDTGTTDTALEQSRVEAVNAAAGAFGGSGSLREMARMGELIEDLDSQQLGLLADKVESMSEEQRNLLLPRLIAHWTKLDPEAATTWIEPRVLLYANEEWFSGFRTSESDLIDAWLDNAPRFAVELARKHADKGLVGSILSRAIRRGPDEDSGRRFDILRTLPPGKDRQKAIITFCFDWAQTDRTAALAAAKSLEPGAERDGAFGEILARWAGEEPNDAFNEAKALGVASSGIMALMVKEAAKSKPLVAAEWLAKHSPESVQQLGGLVVQYWSGKDPAAAFQWARDNGISITESLRKAAQAIPSDAFVSHRYEVGWGSPLSTAMSQNPTATVAWIQRLPAGPERDQYVELIAGQVSDAQLAVSLLSQVTGEAAEYAARAIAARLYFKSPEEARHWAETLPPGDNRAAAWNALGSRRTEPLDLPPGSDRDAMYSGMATGQYYSAPVKSLERVLQIDNPQLRRQTFDDVMALITKGDTQLGYDVRIHGVPAESRQKVQEWLATAKVPEDWKQPWINKLH